MPAATIATLVFLAILVMANIVAFSAVLVTFATTTTRFLVIARILARVFTTRTTTFLQAPFVAATLVTAAFSAAALSLTSFATSTTTATTLMLTTILPVARSYTRIRVTFVASRMFARAVIRIMRPARANTYDIAQGFRAQRRRCGFGDGGGCGRGCGDSGGYRTQRYQKYQHTSRCQRHG